MNARTPIELPGAVITGPGSLMAFVDVARNRLKMSDRELIRRAGLSQNSLRNARTTNRDVMISTAAALLNELGYDLAAVPSGQAVYQPAVMRAMPDLRHKLRDLRTSIANGRHPVDLRHEIDDILFWLERQS